MFLPTERVDVFFILQNIFGVIIKANKVREILLSLSLTVHGSEIRRSPVEVGSLSHDLEGFTWVFPKIMVPPNHPF